MQPRQRLFDCIIHFTFVFPRCTVSSFLVHQIVWSSSPIFPVLTRLIIFLALVLLRHFSFFAFSNSQHTFHNKVYARRSSLCSFKFYGLPKWMRGDKLPGYIKTAIMFSACHFALLAFHLRCNHISAYFIIHFTFVFPQCIVSSFLVYPSVWSSALCSRC